MQDHYARKRISNGKRSSKFQYIQSISAIFVLSTGTGLLNFGSNLLAARALHPFFYSQYAVVAALLGILLVPNRAVTLLAAQHTSRESVSYRSLKRLKRRVIALGLILAVTALVGVPLVLGALSIPGPWWAVWIGLTLPAAYLEAFYVGILQGQKRFFLSDLGRFMNSFIKMAGLIVLFTQGVGVNGAVAVYVFSTSAALPYILYVIQTRGVVRQIQSRSTRRIAKSTGHWSLPFAVITSSLLFFNVDMILAKHFFPAYVSGLFAALNVTGRLIALATGAITTVLFPYLVSSRSRQARGYVFMAWLLTAVITGTIIFTYFGFGPAIIGILFGPQYRGMQSVLPLYGLGFGFFALANVSLTYLLSRNARIIWWDVLGGVILEIVLLSAFHRSLHQFTEALLFSMFVLFTATTIQALLELRRPSH